MVEFIIYLVLLVVFFVSIVLVLDHYKVVAADTVFKVTCHWAVVVVGKLWELFCAVVDFLIDAFKSKPPIEPQKPIPIIPPPPDYTLYVTPVMDCVANNNSQTGLQLPKSQAQHFAPLSHAAYDDPVRGLVFRYLFDREIVGGFHDLKSGQRLRSNIPVGVIGRILNQTIGNYCFQHGLAPVQVSQVFDLHTGRVCIEISALNPNVVPVGGRSNVP